MVDPEKDWIKLHRNLLVNDLWRSEPFTKGQAWVDLLMLANHTEGFFFNRGIKVDVARGQVGMSELQLSIRWKWSRTKVRSFFSLLEKEHQIVQQKNNVNSLITIVNYDTYQSKRQEKEQQEDTKRTPEEHQKDTNKKVKKEKKKTFAVFVAKKIEDYFDLLYDDHPRKERGKDAKRHYLASVKTIEDVGKIESALNNYTAQCKKKDRQFIMQAGTWFNNWKDYQTDDWQEYAADLKTTWEKEYENHQRKEDGSGADDQGVL